MVCMFQGLLFDNLNFKSLSVVQTYYECEEDN